MKQQVHVSMPEYLNTALVRFKHRTPRKPQYQPYQHVIQNYGAKKQYAERQDSAALLDKYGKKLVQQVTGTFLYYVRAVESTMLVALTALVSEQAIPTKNKMEKVMRLLDYAASQEEAVITYHASDMVLACHSNASYLSKPGARIRAGEHFFLLVEHCLLRLNVQPSFLFALASLAADVPFLSVSLFLALLLGN